MAVLVPILLLMVLGSVDLGRIYFANVAITNAAREGAHDLALSYRNYTTTTQMRNAVFQRVLAEATPTLDVGTGSNLITTTVMTSTERVTVTVTYSFTLLFLSSVIRYTSGLWGGPTLQQTNPISSTSGFPVIVGDLLPNCQGGGLTVTPTTVDEVFFDTTSIVVTPIQPFNGTATDPIVVYWDDRSVPPGQVVCQSVTGPSCSFSGGSVTADTLGTHSVFAVQPTTNRCAVVGVTIHTIPPPLLSWTSRLFFTVRWSWTEVVGATTYRLYRCRAPNPCTPTTLRAVVTAPTLYYDDSLDEGPGLYCYEVSATVAGVERGRSNRVCETR